MSTHPNNVTVNLLDLSTLLLILIFLLNGLPVSKAARLTALAVIVRLQGEVGAQLPSGREAVQP